MVALSEINDWREVAGALPRLAEKLPVCTVMSSYLAGGSVLSYMAARRDLAKWVSGLKTLDCSLRIASDLLTMRIDHEQGGHWRWARVGKRGASHLSYRLRLGTMNFWPPEIRDPVGVDWETKGDTLYVRLPPDWLKPRAPGILSTSGGKVTVPEYIATLRFSLTERWIIEQLITNGRRCGVEFLCEALSLDAQVFRRIVTGLNKKLKQGVLVFEQIIETSGALALSSKDRERLQVMIAEARQPNARA